MKLPTLHLVDNWRKVLFGSWANRLAIAASVFGCIELLLPLFQDWFPRGVFAVWSITLAFAVPIARITAQVALHSEDSNGPDS